MLDGRTEESACQPRLCIALAHEPAAPRVKVEILLPRVRLCSRTSTFSNSSTRRGNAMHSTKLKILRRQWEARSARRSREGESKNSDQLVNQSLYRQLAAQSQSFGLNSLQCA